MGVYKGINMYKIISNLENNILSGILIKKGVNYFSKEIVANLLQEPVFQSFLKRGFVIVEDLKIEADKKQENIQLNKSKSNKNKSKSNKNK